MESSIIRRMSEQHPLSGVYAAALTPLNTDGVTNLIDSILILKILSGMNPKFFSCQKLLEADIDGDHKIGMSEGINILRNIANF